MFFTQISIHLIQQAKICDYTKVFGIDELSFVMKMYFD